MWSPVRGCTVLHTNERNARFTTFVPCASQAESKRRGLRGDTDESDHPPNVAPTPGPTWNVVGLTRDGRTALARAVRASDAAERQLLAELDSAESAQLRTLVADSCDRATVDHSARTGPPVL
jgi:hypothetical protein